MEVILKEKEADDWVYRGEGAANLVLSYIGSSPTFVGSCSSFSFLIDWVVFVM